MAGMKKRLRELEADNARLREVLRGERERLERRERYWQERMARYGAPHVHSVISSEAEDVWLMHRIERAVPTPDGLRVEIAKTVHR